MICTQHNSSGRLSTSITWFANETPPTAKTHLGWVSRGKLKKPSHVDVGGALTPMAKRKKPMQARRVDTACPLMLTSSSPMRSFIWSAQPPLRVLLAWSDASTREPYPQQKYLKCHISDLGSGLVNLVHSVARGNVPEISVLTTMTPSCSSKCMPRRSVSQQTRRGNQPQHRSVYHIK